MYIENLAPKIAENLNFDFIDIGKLITQEDFFAGYDDEFKSHILDEDRLLDYLQVHFNFSYFTDFLISGKVRFI